MSSALAVPSGQPTPLWALAAASYLARYSGNTLRSYTDSLRLLFTWCLDHDLDPLDAKRVHLELFVRYLESERRNIPRSVAHHLTPVFGYYRFAVVDDYVKADPTVLLRRPRVFIDESRQLALDKGEMQRLLDAARPKPMELALVAMLGLLGLRVSEAIGARIEDFGMIIRGQPTLKIVGKGGKPATIPLPRKVSDMLVAAVGDRTHGPILVRPPRGELPERPWSRHAAALMLERLCKTARIDKHISPHSLRHTFVTLGLDAGIPLRDMQVAARHADPRVTARYDRGRHDFDTHANHRIAADLLGDDS
jgi:integrase/recombinase XerD